MKKCVTVGIVEFIAISRAWGIVFKTLNSLAQQETRKGYKSCYHNNLLSRSLFIYVQAKISSEWVCPGNSQTDEHNRKSQVCERSLQRSVKSIGNYFFFLSFFLFIFLLCISSLICFNSIETVAGFLYVLYFLLKAYFHLELFWVSQNWNWSSHVGQSERGRLIFESIRTLSKFIYRPKARENVCDPGSTGYSFAFDWSRRLGAFSRPIT